MAASQNPLSLQAALTQQAMGQPTSSGYQPNNAFPYQNYADAGSHVTISPDILNSMQQYGDAAYQSATRQLDPQWAGARSKFDQQMVNQGLAPGSQAYQTAFNNFSNSQNDAYAQARNQSLGQGLQAENQAWQQGYGNASLANELAKAHIAADAQTSSAATSAGASMYDARQAADASKYGSTLGNIATMTGLGLQGQQDDFSNLMQMIGYGNQTTGYNNSLPGQQLNNMLPLLNMIPNSNPTPIDVTGAYGLNANMQNNAYQGQVAQSNGLWGSLGQLGSAALPFFL